MKNKSMFITLNGINELSGGGLYARNLCDYINKKSSSLSIVCKATDDNEINVNFQQIKSLKKGRIADLVSRLFFSPSFLMIYIFDILLHINHVKPESIYIHNSRNGALCLVIKIFFRGKIIVCFDNVESKLSFTNASFKNVKGIISYLDILLCRMSDYLSLRLSNQCIFITKDDRDYYMKDELKDSNVLPIRLPKQEIPKKALKEIDVLFTGTFNFFPNEIAFLDVVEIAKKMPNLRFVVAGRSVNMMSKYDVPTNVTLVDSPTSESMNNLFSSSNLYLSTVTIGSGMKTKLAEAMSFGLPIVCSHHSLIGYDNIKGMDFIKTAVGVDDYVAAIEFFLSASEVSKNKMIRHSHSEFITNYSF
ncbi:glycosyltransferase [Vibrio cyclitrophicus]|nr:glycosyltransferase [Vibrio cyclitrophicus]UPR47541.1 glycosyltransferase [Vibrio cyclitrophicus]